MMRTEEVPVAYLDGLSLPPMELLQRRSCNRCIFGEELGKADCPYTQKLTNSELGLVWRLLHPNPVYRCAAQVLLSTHPYLNPSQNA